MAHRPVDRDSEASEGPPDGLSTRLNVSTIGEAKSVIQGTTKEIENGIEEGSCTEGSTEGTSEEGSSKEGRAQESSADDIRQEEAGGLEEGRSGEAGGA
jgi:hypothetical protein